MKSTIIAILLVTIACGLAVDAGYTATSTTSGTNTVTATMKTMSTSMPSSATSSSSSSSTSSGASSSQRTGLDRFLFEEHRDVRSLAVSGVMVALAGLIIGIGFLTVTFFRQLVATQAIACYKTLAAWTGSIFALVTTIFVAGVVTIAFTLPHTFHNTCDDGSCMDKLYAGQGRDVHTLALSSIWLPVLGYLIAVGLIGSAFLDALQCVTRNCVTVIASYWTIVGILCGLFIIAAVLIALLL